MVASADEILADCVLQFLAIRIARMNAVMKNFVVYRYTEIILFLAGAGIYGYFIFKE